jgi:hypothetical protein
LIVTTARVLIWRHTAVTRPVDCHQTSRPLRDTKRAIHYQT